MVEKIAIGWNAYLFTDRAKGRAPNLLITSHGGSISRPWGFGHPYGRKISSMGGWFTVPSWTTLHFYGPHKASLLDPGMGPMAKGQIEEYESSGPGSTVRNYHLIKFEGDTNENLIYSTNDNHRAVDDFESGLTSNSKADYNKLGYNSAGTLKRVDMLRIRKRNNPRNLFGLWGTTLNNLLIQLEKYGYRYTHIHCCFCRSTTNQMIGFSKMVSHDAEKNALMFEHKS